MRLSKMNPAFIPTSVLLSALSAFLGTGAQAEPGTANEAVMNSELAGAQPVLSILKTLRLTRPPIPFVADYLGRPFHITGWQNIQDGDTHELSEIDPLRVRCDISLASHSKYVKEFDSIQGWASFGSSHVSPVIQIHQKLGVPSFIYDGLFPMGDIDAATGVVDATTTLPSGISYVSVQCYKPASSGSGITVGEIRAAIGYRNFDLDMVSTGAAPITFPEPLDPKTAPRFASPGLQTPVRPSAPAPATPPWVIPSAPTPPAAPPAIPTFLPPPMPTPQLPAPQPPAPQPPAPQPPAPQPPVPRIPRYTPPSVPSSIPRGPRYNPPGNGGSRPPRVLPPTRGPR